LGKLHLLDSGQANLSGLMSLTPRSLAMVRYMLAGADDLRADNPALDEALAWLGVTQRLTSGERLTWQAVPNARPIVELVADADQGKAAPGATCSVEHFSGDDLRIACCKMAAGPRSSRRRPVPPISEQYCIASQSRRTWVYFNR
jgi:hypothetical protein